MLDERARSLNGLRKCVSGCRTGAIIDSWPLSAQLIWYGSYLWAGPLGGLAADLLPWGDARRGCRSPPSAVLRAQTQTAG